jgi:hypothetical protein
VRRHDRPDGDRQPNWDLISEMVTLVAEAYNHASAKGGTPLPPEAWQALQYALARLAIGFVSGPGALASALRRSLLGKPLNTRSVILDVGYADTIPESIRKAVIARDKGCAWPGGCDRRPASCDVHHVRHKRHPPQPRTTTDSTTHRLTPPPRTRPRDQGAPSPSRVVGRTRQADTASSAPPGAARETRATNGQAMREGSRRRIGPDRQTTDENIILPRC